MKKMLLLLCLGLLQHGAADAKTRIKALTFNVWDVGFANGFYNPNRLAAICKKFKEESEKADGWDVIFVQELWPQSRKNALTHCGYPYVAHVENYSARYSNLIMLGLSLFQGDVIDTGLRVLSRYPLGRPRRHTYSENGNFFDTIEDGDWLAAKSAMAVPMFVPGEKPVWLVNTHLVSVNKYTNYHEQRQLQLRELSEFVSEVTRGEPVIMGGDFNLSPRGPKQEPNPMFNGRLWWAFLHRYFKQFQLADPKNEIEKTPTYSRRNTWAAPEDGWQSLDHILASEHFEVESAGVTLTEKYPVIVSELDREEHRRLIIGRTKKDNLVLGVNLSDHFGYEATMVTK